MALGAVEHTAGRIRAHEFPVQHSFSHGDMQAADLREVHAELRGAVGALRLQSNTTRDVIEDEARKIDAGGREVLGMCAQIERLRQHGQANGTSVVDEGATLTMLERQLGQLQLEEGERRRSAELLQARNELELESLARRAAEAERAEADALFRACAGPPQPLRAEIAELELSVDKLRAGEAERMPSEEDKKYLEWYRMLIEDKPEHFSLSIMEAECDNREQQLLELLAPVAFRSALRYTHGISRLDAELADVENGAATRGQSATLAECLQSLSEEGAWRLVFQELREAHDLVAGLRARNDSMAAQISALRWQRCGNSAVAALPPSPLQDQVVENGSEVLSKNGASGPRFATLPLWGVKPSGDTLDAARIPATLSENLQPSRTKREVVHQPNPGDPGLSYLAKKSINRFKPGQVLQIGFESSFGDSKLEEDRSALAQPISKAEELAEMFKVPISHALGVDRRLARMSSPTRGMQKPPSAEWVTFSSKVKENRPTSTTPRVGEGGFAPLDTVPAGIASFTFDGPSMQIQPQASSWSFEDPTVSVEEHWETGRNFLGNGAYADPALPSNFAGANGSSSSRLGRRSSPSNYDFTPQQRSEQM